jgi:hypothetical protein
MDDYSISITISSRSSSGEIKGVAACRDSRISLETLIAEAVGDEDYRFAMERPCSFAGSTEVYRIRSTDMRDTSRIPPGSVVYVGHLSEGAMPQALPPAGSATKPIQCSSVTYFNDQPWVDRSEPGASGDRPCCDRGGLKHGFDHERKDDAIGVYFDPYGLINRVPPSRVAARCRSYADLQALDINPLARRDFVHDEMAINWIWMGSPYDPGCGPDLIRSFLDAGRCTLPILWTDLSSEVVRDGWRMDSPLRRMLEWCADLGVCLISIDDVFCGDEPMTLQPLFNLARLQRQWGLASDILRLEILYRFGGIYSDVDNECLGEILPQLVGRELEPVGQRCGDGELAIGMLGEYPCNAFMIAKKNSALIKKYIEIIRASFRVGRRNLCEQASGGRCPDYDAGFAASTEATVQEVVTRTGPNALAQVLLDYVWDGTFEAGRALDGLILPAGEIVRLLLIFRRDRILCQQMAHEVLLSADPARERLAADCLFRMIVPRERVKIRTSSTWLARRVLSCSGETQSKVALTTVLYQLVNNPPVLDLMNIDHGGDSVLDLLQVIGAHYPELLSGVREAWVPLFYPDNVIGAILDRIGLQHRAQVREVLRKQEHDVAWVLSR